MKNVIPPLLAVLCLSFSAAAGRLRSVGDGLFAPVAWNDTEEGRARNRRVEQVKQ
jgi:flagellar motor protein MotB